MQEINTQGETQLNLPQAIVRRFGDLATLDLRDQLEEAGIVSLDAANTAGAAMDMATDFVAGSVVKEADIPGHDVISWLDTDGNRVTASALEGVPHSVNISIPHSGGVQSAA